MHFLGLNRRGPVAGVVLAASGVASAVALTRGRQMRVKDSDTTILDSSRPPILYLRPFRTDRVESRGGQPGPWMFARPTIEQKMCKALQAVGPLVAIGDPTDSLPVLGADRLYVEDGQWQQTVEELTNLGGTVLLTAYVEPGSSEGLAWEVGHVVDMDQPERIVLIPAPLEEPPLSSPASYETFCRMFGHRFPCGLPAAVGDAKLVYFDAGWTPRLFGSSDAVGNDLPVRATGLAAQRAAVLQRLHSAFGRHLLLDAFFGMLHRRTGLTRQSLKKRLALLSALGTLFAFFVMVWVALHTGNPPALPTGYAEFRDRARHVRLGIPKAWTWIDPAQVDIQREIEALRDSNPKLLPGPIAYENLRFMAFDPDRSAMVTLIAWRHTGGSDENLPQLCEMAKGAYEQSGALVQMRTLLLAGHEGCQLEVEGSLVHPSEGPIEMDVLQDLVVVNDHVYLLTFAGDPPERATIESTLEVV